MEFLLVNVLTFPENQKLLRLWAQAAVTQCHLPGSLSNRNLFFTVLKSEKSKIKVLVDLFLGESPLLDCGQLPC